MIKGLHHNAYRCRDSEETRAFYEDFLGLRMVSAFEINEGRALHTFFEMDDGSCLAFFEVPGSPFDFKRQDSLLRFPGDADHQLRPAVARALKRERSCMD